MVKRLINRVYKELQQPNRKMVNRLEDAQGHFTIVFSERQIETMGYHFTPPCCLFKKADNFKQVAGLWGNRDNYPQLVGMRINYFGKQFGMIF